MACAALFLTVPRKALAPIAFGLLALYYVLMTIVPVPGIGPANLGAETNLGAWLDHAIFGPDHLYRFTRTWDPEGLLSTVPAVSTGLFGLLAGLSLLGPDAPRTKLRKLILPGVLLTVAGLAAHPLFPINKSLWTSSYVLFTSGLSCLFLAACYFAMDLRGWKRGTSLVLAFGMNSIFAYVASELFQTVLHKLPGTAGRDLFKTIYESAFASWIDPPKLASVSWAIVYVGMIAIPVWALYRKRIFLKL
jgi:predicted acyltransferase